MFVLYVQVRGPVLEHVARLFCSAPAPGHVGRQVAHMAVLMGSCRCNDQHHRAPHCIVDQTGNGAHANANTHTVVLRNGMVVQPDVHVALIKVVDTRQFAHRFSDRSKVHSAWIWVISVQPLVRDEDDEEIPRFLQGLAIPEYTLLSSHLVRDHAPHGQEFIAPDGDQWMREVLHCVGQNVLKALLVLIMLLLQQSFPDPNLARDLNEADRNEDQNRRHHDEH
mmetsp:Transcript_28167/g.65422  ORF Transcript_28167/g.65422 Transcript_28167/m.65422 type:complete len:223 (+) Transcript_28167:849-1517(+)